jgi:DNA-binding PadR family transcriptional regulator
MLSALPAKESAHGYELGHAFERISGSAYPSPNIGQIYGTLGRLEKYVLVQGQNVTRSDRPDERVYGLAPAGREWLERWQEALT